MTMINHKPFRGPAGVRADSGANAILAQLQTAVAEMRAEHAQQIADVRRGQEDVVRAEKVARITDTVAELQAEIDRMNARLAAQAVPGGALLRPVPDAEYTDAFRSHMRRGDVQASLNKGTAAEGGYLAPTEWDRTIIERLVLLSPMRSLASAITISTAAFTKLVNLGGAGAGWVGEQAARPMTATGTFGQVSYTTGEMYANPGATQQILDDALIDLESWLAGEIETAFAVLEGAAFFAGDGSTGRPNGILTYVTGGTNAAAHPLGAIPVVNSGAAAALTTDGLVRLVYALPQVFTPGAKFVLNRNTLTAVSLLKDGQGNYIWRPSYVAGQPSTLLGYPVVEAPAMPDIAAGAKPVLFGDFARTYLIVDRQGVRVLRDPFTNKPFVHFYTTKRVGGGLISPEPMRALNVSV